MAEETKENKEYLNITNNNNEDYTFNLVIECSIV